MDVDEAEEYTHALDQTGSGIGQAAAGWWRQIAVGVRLGVPKTLGVPRDEWTKDRRTAIGNMQLREAERKQAVAELTAPVEENGEGLNNSQAADVLGVSESTVREDRKPSRNREDKDEESASRTEPGANGSRNRETEEVRLARLDADLVERVCTGGLSLDEAEIVHAQNEQQVDAWAARVRDGLTVLARMAGHPIPEGIRRRLSDKEGELVAVLDALKPFKEDAA